MKFHFLRMSKSTRIASFLIGILIVGACQTEKHEILIKEDQQGFTEGSEFYTLVERVSMHDGSQDDDFDQSPCLSITFPYRVVVQGVEVRIGSASDLEVILENIRNDGIQDYSLQFPLTIMWSNYETVSVSSRQELAELRRECMIDIAANNIPITCVEKDFPVKLYAYNVNSQKTSTINAANKKQLYVFLQNKNPHEILSFDYPISLSFAGGAEMEVNNNSEFAAALKTCIN